MDTAEAPTVTRARDVKAAVKQSRLCKAGILYEDEVEPAADLVVKTDAKTLDQIDRSRGWLRRFVRRSTLNRTITAEMLRMQAEGQIGVAITTGAFMAACVLEGVTIRRTRPGERDAYTNLSNKIA